MTNHTESLRVHHDADQAPTPARHEPDAHRSLRRASIIGGAGILLLAASAAFGNLVVVEGLVTHGDAARTAEDVMASEGMFRLGIASLYVTVVLDVVVAWALFRVFSPVSTAMSRLAAWFRLAYSGVFMVAIGQLAGIPHLLGSKGYSAVFDEGQLQAQALLRVDAFNDIYFAGLILFGVHLGLLGYLAYRSGYVPRVLGVLLVIAGLGYVFDSFGTVLSQGSPVIVSMVTFLGELLLAFWLVVRGRRLSLGEAGSRDPLNN